MALTPTTALNLLKARGILNPTPFQVKVQERKLQQDENVERKAKEISQTQQTALRKLNPTREQVASFQQRNISRLQGEGRNLPAFTLATGQQVPSSRSLTTGTPPPSFTDTVRDVIMNNFRVQNQRVASLGENLLQSQYDPATLQKFFGGRQFFSPSASIATESAGQRGIEGLFSGLGIAQAGRQRRLEDLIASAEGRVKEQQRLQEQKDISSAKQRSDYVNKFLSLREDFGKKGISLNEEAGRKFFELLQSSDNPSEIYNRYVTEAFKNPEVVKAYTKKKTGSGAGTVSFSKEQKQKALVLGFTPQEIADPKKQVEILRAVYAEERTIPAKGGIGTILFQPEQKLTIGKPKKISRLSSGLRNDLREDVKDIRKDVEDGDMDEGAGFEELKNLYPDLDEETLSAFYYE